MSISNLNQFSQNLNQLLYSITLKRYRLEPLAQTAYFQGI